MRICKIFLTFLGLAYLSVQAQNSKPLKAGVLKEASFKSYIDYFNTMEKENIAQAIPNAQSWEWLKNNIPLFECPQQNFEELFYFRWWTLRKHIKKTEKGFVFTEFLVQRSYSDKYNLIASALGHHIYESRWLLDPTYMNQDLLVWYRGNEGKPLKKLRFYSSWNMDAIYNRFLVNKDTAYVKNLYPDLLADYAAWEMEKRLKNGLFWQYDVRDAMEETISGGRKEKNARPSINSYMFGNARALSAIATIAGDSEHAALFQRKADTLKNLVQSQLWNEKEQFFEARKEADTLANVREAIGFIPWYFNLPDSGYASAWKFVNDTEHFCAPFGLTTADRAHPKFRTRGCCNCEWDGAVWPFATSQTLTGMAHLLQSQEQSFVKKEDYFKLLETYAESQYYRGRPYIGEYLDEKTGYWLKGDQERSRYYNHSTFNDLLITGLIGIKPHAEDVLELSPLLTEAKWPWFCLDKLSYHGKVFTILWDVDGSKYKKGKGLIIWANGKKIWQQQDLKPLIIKL